jgi:7,8-dihydropterin-6-yl-methyl-4-(beta-D-ribofuranosyl)aminobenzene 5'-phosphate synthase
MHLITLIEDSRGIEGLKSQHGLSFLIRTAQKTILFDTGQDATVLKNARMLGIDLSEVDFVVISHGHYDHAGGLDAFLNAFPRIPVYLHRGSGEVTFVRDLFRYRPIGLQTDVLTRYHDRFIWIDTSTEIVPGICLLAHIPRSEPVPAGNRCLLVKKEGKYQIDTFLHEIVLVVVEEDGMVVVTGCGHSGVTNIVLAAKSRYPAVPVKAVIGGFHLIDRSFPGFSGENYGELRSIARKLSNLGCQQVVTGHCTGRKAAVVLGDEFREGFGKLYPGYSKEF